MAGEYKFWPSTLNYNGDFPATLSAVVTSHRRREKRFNWYNAAASIRRLTSVLAKLSGAASGVALFQLVDLDLDTGIPLGKQLNFLVRQVLRHGRHQRVLNFTGAVILEPGDEIALLLRR